MIFRSFCKISLIVGFFAGLTAGRTSERKRGFDSYGILSEDNSYFYVDTAKLDQYVVGVDYVCIAGTNNCIVYADVRPDSLGRVHKNTGHAYAGPHGTFTWIGGTD